MTDADCSVATADSTTDPTTDPTTDSTTTQTTDSGLFDRWSSTYDGAGLQWSTYRPVHDAVMSRLRGVDPSTVVDLGCGTGQLTRRLIRRFPAAEVIGVDLSDGMLARAAVRTGRSGPGTVTLVRADAHDLPFAPASVDVVVCTESFHWYRDQRRVVDHLAIMLRPGGRLLIASIATVTDLGDRLLRRSTASAGNEIRARPPGRLRELLNRSGFDVLDQHRIPRFGLVAWPVLTDARRDDVCRTAPTGGGH